MSSGKSTVSTSSVLKQLVAVMLRMRWPVMVALGLATIAGALLQLVPPLLLKRIIDSYLNVGRLDGLTSVAAAYVLALAATSVVGFVQVFVNTYVGQTILLELRSFLAEHLGGMYEPIGQAFENSSITVPIGAGEVPGLTKALQKQ